MREVQPFYQIFHFAWIAVNLPSTSRMSTIPYGQYTSRSTLLFLQPLIILMHSSEYPYIPLSAFLYFPRGDEVRVGTGEKQWRKIFENGEPYDQFQEDALGRLDGELQAEKVEVDQFFTRANKLRYLQANKFKVSSTVDSIREYSKWRAANFPVQLTPQISRLLNSKAIYFCGRDQKYRPIIVADIGKFNPDTDTEHIPAALVYVFQFIIKELLIEGQVENYVFVMNLSQFGLSMKSVVSKLISFTSNSYRGRLFASYLLGMPTILSWIWSGIVSNFVSQNTLHKLKISKELNNPEMWSHISPETIETKYGGTLELTETSWPPIKQRLLFEDTNNKQDLITPAEYQKLFKLHKLGSRKIQRKFIQGTKTQHKVQDTNQDFQLLPEENILISKIDKNLKTQNTQPLSESQILMRAKKESPKPKAMLYGNIPLSLIKEQPDEETIKNQSVSKGRLSSMALQHNSYSMIPQESHSIIHKFNKKNEGLFIKEMKPISTFFASDRFRSICNQ